MEVTIYQTEKGKSVVSVRGSSKNSPEAVTKAYKAVLKELEKERNK